MENAEIAVNQNGITQEEFDLIQQLIQKGMERNAPIEYEQIEGYEVPPRTQFSMLNKPALSIKYGQMTFNMACIRLFEGIQYILPLINAEKKKFAIALCKEEESAAIIWAKKKGEHWVNKSITAPDFVEDFFKIMGWNRRARYKVLGRVAMSERGLILVFDLSDFVMFDEKPEEYLDKKTGQMKKRHIKYYPDQYRERYGKTYSDYMATHPQDTFESYGEYTNMKAFSELLSPQKKDDLNETEIITGTGVDEKNE